MNLKYNIDIFGIFLSMACVLHCLLAPIVLLILPISKNVLFNENIHKVLLLLMIIICGAAFIKGVLKHKKVNILVFFFIGVLIQICGLVLHDIKILDVISLEILLTFIGSMMIIYGHFLNINNLKNISSNTKCI